MPNWIKIRTEYQMTNISYRKIAEKYGVSFNTLKDRAKRENWAKNKEETQHKIATATLRKAVMQESDRNARHIAIIDKILTKVEQIVDEELNKSSTSYGRTIESDLILVEKLDVAMKVLEKAQRSHRIALNMDEKSQSDTDKVNSNIQRLADLINKPVPNRNISDFDEEEE